MFGRVAFISIFAPALEKTQRFDDNPPFASTLLP